MKTQIRKNIFETNSSSMHAITVTAKKTNVYTGFCCDFVTGEFGWEHITYYDFQSKASYLWTAIVNKFIKYVEDEGTWKGSDGKKYSNYHYVFDKDNPQYIKYREAIRTALIHAGIEDDGYSITFQEDFKDNGYGLGTGYIDHAPKESFIESLVFNEDRLIRFLFNDKSQITTWNDNEWYYEGEDEDDEIEPYPYEIDWDDEESLNKYHEWEDRENWKYFGINPDDPNIEWKYLKHN